MDLSSLNASPVLADPAPINQTILGFHSSVFSLSSGTSFPLLIPKKKPGKLDDVGSNGWLDAMQSSSPPRKKMLKDVGVELARDDSDLVYYSWMLKYPSALQSFNCIINRAKKKKIVIFLDYDGTLSPIVDDPNRAFMSIDMRAVVKGVAKYFPTAIISGRNRDKQVAADQKTMAVDNMVSKEITEEIGKEKDIVNNASDTQEMETDKPREEPARLSLVTSTEKPNVKQASASTVSASKPAKRRITPMAID